MTDIGIADLSAFVPDAHRTDDNLIYLGRSLRKVSQATKNKTQGCKNDKYRFNY